MDVFCRTGLNMAAEVRYLHTNPQTEMSQSSPVVRISKLAQTSHLSRTPCWSNGNDVAHFRPPLTKAERC
jgi:hypothetical protein